MAKQLTVRCQGAGEPVYLIGGGPAFTTWNLEPIQGHLRKHYRVCRWDMRGVGDNAGLTLPPDKPALSVWLADMAAALPPEPVLLWGHSCGDTWSELIGQSAEVCWFFPAHVSPSARDAEGTGTPPSAGPKTA